MSERICLLPLILCLSLISFAQTKDESRSLVPGQPVAREIAGGKAHNYRITLQPGQFIRVVLEPKAIDLALALGAPDGQQSVDTNINAAGGLESLSAEAAAGGDYRVTVSAIGAAALAGSYRIRLEAKSGGDGAGQAAHERRAVAVRG